MKAVVVGLGVMGKHHVRTLQRLGLHVETIDPDPYAGADWLEAVPLPDADIACIATPPAYLAQEAAKALLSGMDVLVEKPMACDLDQARILLKAEQETGGKLRVGYVERWNPATVALRDALPLVGTVRHVTAQRLGLRPRCPRTGPELDLLTHDIDVLRFLGLWPRFLHGTVNGAHVSVTLALKDDASATLQASHLHPKKQRTLTVVGDDGMLSLDYQRQTLVFHDERGARELDVDRREPLEAQWSAFLEDRGVTSGDALATLRLALRAQARAATTTQLGGRQA